MIDDPKNDQLDQEDDTAQTVVSSPAEEQTIQEADDAEIATDSADEENKTPEPSIANETENDVQEEIANDVKEAKAHEEELTQESESESLEEAKKLLNQTDSDTARWYIVHTYSGHENKVAKSIKQRVQSLGFENRIFDIIVPTRNTIKVSQGKKETVKEKIFPGYVLVKMALDDESWLLIRTTQGVTAFIGAGNKPTPISDKEVEAIQKFMNEDEPLYKTSFTIGEAVKIVDGPFADFLGTIDNIDDAKGKLKVLVSIFGRETPVELDFLQVNKL